MKVTVYVSGQRNPNGLSAAAYGLHWGGQWHLRQAVDQKKYRSYFGIMEVRAMVSALNALPPGQDVEIVTLNKQAAHKVSELKRKGHGLIISEELMSEVTKAVERHMQVQVIVATKKTMPPPMKQVRDAAMNAVGLTDEMVERMPRTTTPPRMKE